MKIKNIVKEKNLLPLTFNYMEVIEIEKHRLDKSNVIYYLICDKYQTNFYTRQKPFKDIIRML